MNMRPRGLLRGRSSRNWLFTVRHLVSALLLFAVPIGVAALTLSLARPMPGPGVVRIGQFAILLLSPALLFGATCWAAPRGVRAVHRAIDNRRAETNLLPSYPPIERIAADLRRLLWEHDRFARLDDITTRTLRLSALEAAITYRATQAARALEVPHPDPLALSGLGKPQLRRLLHALAAEGLVLPPAVGLLAPDSRANG
jgi:hypothetical protein